MPITVIPRQPAPRTGVGEFVDAANPYIQQAFALMLKRQMEEQQRQRNMEQAQQMFPDAFTQPSYEELAGQRGIPTNLQYPQALPQDQREAFYKDVYTRKFGAEIPSKYKKFSMEKAKQYPGLGVDFTTGATEYKVPSTMQTMPIINITSEGKMEQIGTAPKGAKIVSALGEPSTAQQKFEAEQQEKKIKLEEKSEFIVSRTQDTLDTIAEVRKGVDKGYFGLYGVIPAIPGTEKYTWQQNINKLLAGKMVELMTQMKEASKTGATGFGQLSEKEGQILRDASTALKRGISGQEATEILNKMEQVLNKVVNPIQNQPQQSPQLPQGFNPDEWEIVK